MMTNRIKVWHLLVFMVPIALICSMMPMVRAARRAGRESMCNDNMGGKLKYALADAWSREGRYPSAVIRGPDGKPMHSWRAQLDFVRIDYADVPYSLIVPWDHPSNRPAGASVPRILVCENNQVRPGQFTNYVAVTDHGVSTFDRANTMSKYSIAATQQALIIEYPNSDIFWTEPRDLDVTELHKLAEGNDPQGLCVLFADGRNRRMPRADVLKLFGR